jgi:hypothetical protein
MAVTDYLTIYRIAEGLVTFGTLFGMLYGGYKRRGRIWNRTKWVSCKGFGLIAIVFGSVVLGSVVLAIREFPRFLIFTSAESIVGSFIGAGVGAAAFAGFGSYAVLGGVWMMFPNTRPGQYVKRRFFRRHDHEGRKVQSPWTGFRKRIPAAGILRFFLFRLT